MARGGKKGQVSGQQEASAQTASLLGDGLVTTNEAASAVETPTVSEVNAEVAAETASPAAATTPGGVEVFKAPPYEPEEDEDDEGAMEEVVEPAVINAAAPTDPAATPAATFLYLAKLYNDAGVLSVALTKHMRSHADQPELFAYMQRMLGCIGDFRHAAEQITSGISEELANAIRDAVA